MLKHYANSAAEGEWEKEGIFRALVLLQLQKSSMLFAASIFSPYPPGGSGTLWAGGMAPIPPLGCGDWSPCCPSLSFGMASGTGWNVWHNDFTVLCVMGTQNSKQLILLFCRGGKQWRFCGKMPIFRRKFLHQKAWRFLRFQAHKWREAPNRERKRCLLDGNSHRLYFQQLYWICFTIWWPMSLLSLKLLSGAISLVQSLICAIFLAEKHVYQSPRHSEALLSPWCLLSPLHPSSLLRVFCEGRYWAFPLFISLPSLVWKEMTNKSFHTARSKPCQWGKNNQFLIIWLPYQQTYCFFCLPCLQSFFSFWEILEVIIPLSHFVYIWSSVWNWEKDFVLLSSWVKGKISSMGHQRCSAYWREQ